MKILLINVLKKNFGMLKPDYPVYILSKGRADNCLTAKFMVEDKCDFYLVVEVQEYEDYKRNFPDSNILVLPPESTGGGAIPVRNWIWKHSESLGFKKHWEFDDNIRNIGRLHRGKRIRCNANIGIKVVEDFTDRYTNIAISGFNYQMFVMNDTQKPFVKNCHVYSGMLIDNSIPYKWRLKYNADTDLCLQVLTNNLCTVQFNAFYIDKQATMTMKGGNTDRYKENGRYQMARTLEEIWPDHVETKWRFGRAQHVIKGNWRYFTQPLIRRSDIDWDEISNKKYKIGLKQVEDTKSKSLKDYKKNYDKDNN